MTFKLTYVLLIASGCALAGYFLRGSPESYYDRWKAMSDSLAAMSQRMIAYHDSLSRHHEQEAAQIDTSIQKEAKRSEREVATIADKTTTNESAIKYYWEHRASVPGYRVAGRVWSLDSGAIALDLPEFRHVIATSMAFTSTTAQFNLSRKRADELSNALTEKNSALRQAQASVQQQQWIIEQMKQPVNEVPLFSLSVEVTIHGLWNRPFLDMNQKVYNLDVPIDIHTDGFEISLIPLGFMAYPENGKLQSGTTHGVRGKIKVI